MNHYFAPPHRSPWLSGSKKPSSPSWSAKYGEDLPFAMTIIHASDPATYAASIAAGEIPPALVKHHHGDDAKSAGDEGLYQNVYHKLNFVLRTGLNSSEAQGRPDLVEPGDFPFAGAGYYRGYCGGLSGFKEEADWWIFCQIVDKYIELRAAAAQPAIAACKSRTADSPAGTKYLMASTA